MHTPSRWKTIAISAFQSFIRVRSRSSGNATTDDVPECNSDTCNVECSTEAQPRQHTLAAWMPSSQHRPIVFSRASREGATDWQNETIVIFIQCTECREGSLAKAIIDSEVGKLLGKPLPWRVVPVGGSNQRRLLIVKLLSKMAKFYLSSFGCFFSGTTQTRRLQVINKINFYQRALSIVSSVFLFLCTFNSISLSFSFDSNKLKK